MSTVIEAFYTFLDINVMCVSLTLEKEDYHELQKPI